MKDWTGNSNSIFKQLGASNHCSDEREANDFYATDPKAVDDLIRTGVLDDVQYVWECACGAGHLSDRLRERGFHVVATDLIDRGAKDSIGGVDFLEGLEGKDTISCSFPSSYAIITNPPYKYATEFMLKGIELMKERCTKMCLFLKLTTLEGIDRYEKVYSKNPPSRIYVYSRRIQCAKNGEFKGSSAVCYAWFVWEPGKGETKVSWI